MAFWSRTFGFELSVKAGFLWSSGAKGKAAWCWLRSSSAWSGKS